MQQPDELPPPKIEKLLSHIPEHLDPDTYPQVVSAVRNASGGDLDAAAEYLNKWSRESREDLYRSDLSRYSDPDASLLDLARDHGYEPESTRQSSGRKSQANRLIERIRDIEVFKTPTDEAYSTYQAQGAQRTARIDSSRFKEYLRHRYYQSGNRTLSNKALAEVVSFLQAKATYGACEHPVYLRVAETDGAIYIDLGDDSWEAVEVTATGWSITSDPPVKFRRTPGMAPLPRPSGDGNLSQLRSFLPSMSDDDFALLLGWMVQALRAVGPYPILAITGEQGSAKSTTTSLIRTLIDPAEMRLRDLPSKKRDLAVAAENSWVLAFDNMDTPASTLSDALCRLSTGGGFATRTLYSNREETIFTAQRPIILNGITGIVKRPDLADRAIQIELKAISPRDRKKESTLWSEFEAQQASIFSGLLSALSAALKNRKTISLSSLPRMADFAEWAAAAEPAFPTPPGTFQPAYKDNRLTASRKILDEEPLAQIIYDVVCEEGRWEGKASDLLELARERWERYTNQSPPNSPQAVTAIRERLLTDLRLLGIGYERVRERDRTFAFYCDDTRLQPEKTSVQALPEGPDPSNQMQENDDKEEQATFKSAA